MSKTVFITGAMGYIGRLLTQTLAQDPAMADVGKIVAGDIRLPEPAQRLDGVEYVKADIREPNLVDQLRAHKVDMVVHLAAVVSPGKDMDRAFLHAVEVQGTRNVLEACLAAGVAKFIYTSSGAAYGYHADNPAWLCEDDACRGNAEFAYSDHKRQVEEMLADFRQKHPELKQLIFRVCTILGRHTRNQITDLFDGKRVMGLSGAQTPFVFIWDMDVVGAIVKGIRDADAQGVYNLAGDGALTMAELAEIMGKPHLSLPTGLVKAALWVMQKVGATQYGPEQVMFLQYRPVLDNARLKSEFGYTPLKTSREVFDYFLAHRAGGAAA